MEAKKYPQNPILRFLPTRPIKKQANNNAINITGMVNSPPPKFWFFLSDDRAYKVNKVSVLWVTV